MRIEVAVFATLRRYMPELGLGKTKTLEVEPGTTMAEVVEMLGLPKDEVQIVVRNHRHADLSDAVTEGDRIAFVPAIGGG
jgi:molybdopterin synthase sulfur carrier subunit